MPARIKTEGFKTVLVASFLVNDSDLVDINREIVHFLRGEMRKRTSFEILDVTPPPAVPEQTLDDMAKNAEFFRWLAREHGADIVVSGGMRYSKRDASGFESAATTSSNAHCSIWAFGSEWVESSASADSATRRDSLGRPNSRSARAR